MALTAGDNNENPLQMTSPVSLCYGNSSKMLYILSFERRRWPAFSFEFFSSFFHLQTQHPPGLDAAATLRHKGMLPTYDIHSYPKTNGLGSRGSG